MKRFIRVGDNDGMDYELDWVPTDALIQEVLKRSTDCVVARVFPNKQGDDMAYELCFHPQGNPLKLTIATLAIMTS